MGACVSSLHKDSDSNMKPRQSFGSKTNKVVIPSPVKGNKPIVNGVAVGGLNSQPVAAIPDFGSKEDTFFDSQPWLDSDCDDFFSVNGDFTPSRGNTPVHEDFSLGTPRVNRALFDNKTPTSKPEPSPTNKRKKLAELFRDSLRADQDVDDHNMSGNQNGVNGIVEANGDYRSGKGKQIKSAQCCLPRMLSSRSFRESKKTSPVLIIR